MERCMAVEEWSIEALSRRTDDDSRRYLQAGLWIIDRQMDLALFSACLEFNNDLWLFPTRSRACIRFAEIVWDGAST